MKKVLLRVLLILIIGGLVFVGCKKLVGMHKSTISTLKSTKVVEKESKKQEESITKTNNDEKKLDENKKDEKQEKSTENKTKNENKSSGNTSNSQTSVTEERKSNSVTNSSSNSGVTKSQNNSSNSNTSNNSSTNKPQNNSNEGNMINKNTIDYSFHKGRTEKSCNTHESCTNQGISFYSRYKKVVDYFSVLDVTTNNGNVIGYFIEYVFKEAEYDTGDSCNSIGASIKSELSDRVTGFKCSNRNGKYYLNITTDYD